MWPRQNLGYGSSDMETPKTDTDESSFIVNANQFQ